MKSEYQYPIDLDWSVEEMVDVTNFYALIEEANEGGVSVEKLLASYTHFKSVVRSIAEEKRIDREFQKASTYSIYRTIQKAKELKKGRLKMGD